MCVINATVNCTLSFLSLKRVVNSDASKESTFLGALRVGSWFMKMVFIPFITFVTSLFYLVKCQWH
jgi:hypothetical protein